MDLKRISSLILCGLVGGLVDFPAAAKDNSWKKEIDNGVVQVFRRVVTSRETAATTELPPGLLIFLTDYSIRLTGAKRQEELRGKRSQFLWHSGGRIGLE